MRSGLTKAQRAYYGVFALSMVICWSPWKALAYFAPLLAILWYLWAARNRVARLRALQWVAAWLALIATYWAFSRGFDVAPAVLALLTYGTFAVVYVIPSKDIASEKLMGRMLRLAASVVTVEATFGLAQAVAGALRSRSFDLANGDVVQGTIFPSLHSSRTFANPMFAANMVFMLIGLLPIATVSKRWRGTVMLGITSFVVASVVHDIFFLAAASVAGYILCRPPLRLGGKKGFLVLASGALFMLTYIFLSANVLSFVPIVRQALGAESPRAVAVAESLILLPRQYPLMPLVGLGPGQFSSNAALMASGTYLGGGGRSVPLIRPQSSHAFKEYLADLVVDARNPAFGGSSTVEPFFSWLSVYTEFGLPCLIGVLWWAAAVVRRVRREALRKNERMLGAALVTGIVFFALLGLLVDYWEVPQAVLVGALLLKVMYATLVGRKSVPVPNAVKQLG